MNRMELILHGKRKYPRNSADQLVGRFSKQISLFGKFMNTFTCTSSFPVIFSTEITTLCG